MSRARPEVSHLAETHRGFGSEKKGNRQSVEEGENVFEVFDQFGKIVERGKPRSNISREGLLRDYETQHQLGRGKKMLGCYSKMWNCM